MRLKLPDWEVRMVVAQDKVSEHLLPNQDHLTGTAAVNGLGGHYLPLLLKSWDLAESELLVI
jgi:hypothetical protein